jgi:hypothetical protein
LTSSRSRETSSVQYTYNETSLISLYMHQSNCSITALHIYNICSHAYQFHHSQVPTYSHEKGKYIFFFLTALFNIRTQYALWYRSTGGGVRARTWRGGRGQVPYICEPCNLGTSSPAAFSSVRWI